MNKKVSLADLERENERLRLQLVELDELPTKKRAGTISDLAGVQDMNTGISKGIRSMPGQEDRYYLDLYLLQKERERLIKETRWIKKRRLRVGRKVVDIDKERAEKEEQALPSMTILSSELSTSKADEKPAKEGKAKKQAAPKRYEYKEEEWNKLSLDY